MHKARKKGCVLCGARSTGLAIIDGDRYCRECFDLVMSGKQVVLTKEDKIYREALKKHYGLK
jgi:hypothetical protein